MNILNKILIFVLLLSSMNSFCQFQYTEYDELRSFSYLSKKIIDLKKTNKINTLNLPSYNNDSLYFVNNIWKFLPGYNSRTCGGACGFIIDTTIDFFNAATRIKIDEGYVWLYKIYSPTAIYIGFDYKNCNMDSNEYFSAHTNFYDSINGSYDYQLPEIIYETTSRNYKEYDSTYTNDSFGGILGNLLYIEYFSKSKNVKDKPLTLFNISYNYGFKTSYKLSDAPKWIREKYPDVDFDKK